MKTQFANTFFESLKRMIIHQKWWYKIYENFKTNIPLFFKNIWKFRKELYTHQWWDYRYTLNILERSLTIMEKEMSIRGMEISETREPKVKSMRRALELLKNNREDNYIEMAEKEIGKLIMYDWEFEKTDDGIYQLIDNETEEEKRHNRAIFKRAHEIEESEWKELWEIFKGSKNSKHYGENYDGTDMRSWWD